MRQQHPLLQEGDLMVYQPPRKYRPRYFTPIGWMIVGVLCTAAVIWGVLLIWVIDALHH